jgi:mannose-6-phosphate isomerase
MKQQEYHPIKLQPMRVRRTYTGGELLDRMQSISPAKDGNMPEEWVASTITSRFDPDPHAGLSIIGEGANAGRFLKDIIASDPEGILGGAHVDSFGESLGFLAKLIDSDKRLNIQTHPDNRKAKKYFDSPFGKTEAWYIIDTRVIEGTPPFIYLGFKPGITKENWVKWVETQDTASLENALHKIPVNKGDVFLVESGMPHAIGTGCFLAEIQEPTDYTFRVEKMMDGAVPYPEEVYHQGIGYERMFNCFDYTGYLENELLERFKIAPRTKDYSEGYEFVELLGSRQTARFAMDKLVVYDACTIPPTPTFGTAVVLSGRGSLMHGDSTMIVQRSNELFLPVSDLPLSFHTEGDEPLELLIFHPPAS